LSLMLPNCSHVLSMMGNVCFFSQQADVNSINYIQNKLSINSRYIILPETMLTI